MGQTEGGRQEISDDPVRAKQYLMDCTAYVLVCRHRSRHKGTEQPHVNAGLVTDTCASIKGIGTSYAEELMDKTQ